MNEISRNLTNCERYLKTATEAIAHGTMTPEQHEQARKAVILARGQLDEAYGWLYDNKPSTVPKPHTLTGREIGIDHGLSAESHQGIQKQGIRLCMASVTVSRFEAVK